MRNLSIAESIKRLTWLDQYTEGLQDFFWTRRKAALAGKWLRDEIAAIEKAAYENNAVAGYRGYVLDTEKTVIVLKTPLYVQEDHCLATVSSFVAALSVEYVDPNNLLVVVEPVKFGEAEKSDADILDDATLDLPKGKVLRDLQLTAVVDILDILREHGVYEATFGDELNVIDEIDQ